MKPPKAIYLWFVPETSTWYACTSKKVGDVKYVLAKPKQRHGRAKGKQK